MSEEIGAVMKSPLFVPLLLLVCLACDKPRAATSDASEPEASDEARSIDDEPEPVFVEPPPATDDPREAGAAHPVASGGGAPDSGLSWFTTCGDPVCGGYDGPWPGVPACGGAQERQACSPEGATCDFQSSCNARLICAAEDPKQRPGGCPISRARFKRDIEYLDEAELERYYRELQRLKLASYRYREAADDRVRLGVILEDGERRELAVWADPAHDRVDLYGYASLAIAGVQAQARELDQLRAELAELRRELDQLHQRCDPR